VRTPRFVAAMGRRWRWIAGAVAALALLVVAVDILIDEPLRRYMVREVNERLHGYTLDIGRVDFHVLGLGVTLINATLVQDQHPTPAVATFPKLEASVQWREIIFGRLVANFRLAEPKLHVNRAHLEKEAKDETPIEQRGWQEALLAIYPLKINEFRIDDGDVMYIDDERHPPLHLTGVNAIARNIRNIHSRDRDYPSPIRVEAALGEGRLALEGHADFLKVPHLGVNADVRVDDIGVDYFAPILRRYNVAVKQGMVSLAGRVEYAPTVKIVDLRQVAGGGLVLDYVHVASQATEKTKRVAKQAAKEAEKVANAPDVLVRVAELVITRSTFGYVNRTKTPDYRVFIADTELRVENLTNHLTEGTATAKLTGKFMGSGDTLVTAAFRPERNGPDFDLNLKVENTQLPAMNDLLRAHGKFDVVSGLFSVYSEIGVKNRRVNGYVKPLFSNLDVYDKEQDRAKKPLRKLYEKAVGVIGKVLKNQPRDEVATVADIAGPLEDPNANTLQVILRLIQNAFFKAILPGFDREIRPGRRPAIARAPRE
jgi:hypothetical protein